jgi:hypothetical protein
LAGVAWQAWPGRRRSGETGWIKHRSSVTVKLVQKAATEAEELQRPTLGDMISKLLPRLRGLPS